MAKIAEYSGKGDHGVLHPGHLTVLGVVLCNKSLVIVRLKYMHLNI